MGPTSVPPHSWALKLMCCFCARSDSIRSDLGPANVKNKVSSPALTCWFSAKNEAMTPKKPIPYGLLSGNPQIRFIPNTRTRSFHTYRTTKLSATSSSSHSRDTPLRPGVDQISTHGSRKIFIFPPLLTGALVIWNPQGGVDKRAPGFLGIP